MFHPPPSFRPTSPFSAPPSPLDLTSKPHSSVFQALFFIVSSLLLYLARRRRRNKLTMAEVLGTVVGVVSLGLQVCAGINTYLDGVQCRKEDLEYTERSCKSMEALLKQIEALQNRISATMRVDRTTLEEAMAAAKAELSLLNDFVGEICTRDVSSSSRSALKKIKEQQRKLLYPFRKDHLHRLNDRLETASSALLSALHLTELEISLNHGRTLHGLQASLDSLTQGVSNMNLEMKTSIRHLHSDTTASHLTLEKVQKNSEEATAILSISHEDTVSFKEDLTEVKTLLAALMGSDGRAALPKLVSKPDALRRISDIAGSGSPNGVPILSAPSSIGQSLESRAYPEFQCTCTPRRVLKRSRRQIGPACMEQEHATAKFHAPRCPFARFHTPSDENWSFGISVKMLGGMLRAALTISMSATFGAGGFGLSPSFTYFPIREDSPASQVLSLIRDAFENGVWSDEDADIIIHRGVKTLQVTLAARKWTPLDIDEKGQTLLEFTSRLRSKWQGKKIKILTFLVSLGVPRDRPDNEGEFPFHSFPKETHSRRDNAEAFDLLWPDELDAIPLAKSLWMYPLPGHLQLEWSQCYRYSKVKAMADYMVVATLSVKLRKLYEGHIMQAIIQKSTPILFDIMKKDMISSELSATDTFGYKMLHYLLGWPEGLCIVVERYGDSVLQIDDQDQSRILLLECALMWSGRVCVSSNLECCTHECTCAEAVEKVLEAERSRPLKLRQHEHWVLAMLSASMKARDLVIDDLRCRREELRELGLLHLTSKQIDQMDLQSPKVLDYHTGEVLNALKTVGLIVPPRLETEFKALREDKPRYYVGTAACPPNLGIQGSLRSQAASVYHILGNSPNTGGIAAVRALADSLYSKGFMEIDLPDFAGATPLTGRRLHENPPQDFFSWNWGTSIESWLIEHGASLDTQIPDRVNGYTTSHLLFRRIGFQCGFTKESGPFQIVHSSWESQGESQKRALDTCQCKCSVGGCNPYNIMWKTLLESVHVSWKMLDSRRNWLKDFGSIDDQDGRRDYRQYLTSFVLEPTSLIEEACELSRPVKSMCLRACTFAMLPLRHTCCHDGRRRCDDEEIREIWEEDQTDIDRLEMLLDEFEKKLEEMGCSLAEFYRAHWIDRMSEVLQQMDEQILTATEIEEIERLGVKLTVEKEDFGYAKTKVVDKSSVEYWLERMNRLQDG